MDNILVTHGLTKTYSRRKVVNDVSLNLGRGEIYGLIGRNGAGKTTFMRLVLGLAIPDSGTIELFGGENPQTAGQKIGSIIEAPALYGGCSAFENLKLFSILSKRRTSLERAVNGAGFTTRRTSLASEDGSQAAVYSAGKRPEIGHDDDHTLRDLIDIVGLSDAGNKKVGHFSLGMKQRLGLAVAMLGDPELMILDEPVNGLDPAGIKDIRDTIIRLNAERGVTFLISSHLLDELSKIATKYGIINNGMLVDEITTTELADRCRRPLLITVDDPVRAVNILTGSAAGAGFVSGADNLVNTTGLTGAADPVNTTGLTGAADPANTTGLTGAADPAGNSREGGFSTDTPAPPRPIASEDIRTEGNIISIYNHNADAAQLNTLLVTSGIAVSGLSSQNFSIEDYFIERMGA